MRRASCFHCGSKRRKLYRAALSSKGMLWRVLVCREHRECPDCEWAADWAQPWKEVRP